MVNNASSQDYVSQLQLMDILPVKGDYSTGNFERISDFRLKYDSIQSIEIENRKDTGSSEEKFRALTMRSRIPIKHLISGYGKCRKECNA